MSHSFYVLKPSSGGSKATSVDDTSPKKTTLAHGNPAGDAGVVGNTASPMSGAVPNGG